MTRHVISRLAIFASMFAPQLAVADTGGAAADAWPRFRGPNGAGISQAKTVPASWKETDINWKIKLPGGGHSSPVSWGGKIFVTAADTGSGKRHLLAIDAASGKELWRRSFDFEPDKKHKVNSYASCTPAVDADRVYVLWQNRAQSELAAFSHDGKPAWSVDLGQFRAGHGSAVSPIVYGDLVVLCSDQKGPSFLLALDRASGKQVWKVERNTERACYSTPCVREPSYGPPELIFTHSFQGITGVDPKTGATLWEIKPFGTHQQRACASPVAHGDLVIGTSGFASAEKRVVAVRPKRVGEETAVTQVYTLKGAVPHVPTPLAYKEWLFLWSDKGIVSCHEIATGRQVWQKRVGGNYFASPICVDGRLFNIDTRGTVVVLAADDKYKVLARNEPLDPSNATLAVVQGALVIRTESRLVSVGGKK